MCQQELLRVGEFIVKVQLALVLHMYKDGTGYSEAVRELEERFILTVLQEVELPKILAYTVIRCVL